MPKMQTVNQTLAKVSRKEQKENHPLSFYSLLEMNAPWSYRADAIAVATLNS